MRWSHRGGAGTGFHGEELRAPAYQGCPQWVCMPVALNWHSQNNRALSTELAQRAFTLLNTMYGEVSAAGAWLWRHEDPATLFPSLYAVGRAARASGKPSGGEPGAGKDGSAAETKEG